MDIVIGHVTGTSVGVIRDGQEPGRLLQVMFSGPSDVQTVELPQPGIEYHPPKGTRVFAVQGGAAYKVAVGTDDAVEPIMDPGGMRIYATDAEGTAVTGEVRLHPTGSAEVFNAEAAVTLAPDGTIAASNDGVTATLAPDGTVTVANANGSFTMSPAGEFTFHGTATHFDHPVSVAGDITVTGDITVDGTVKGTTDVVFGDKSALGHTHITTTVGQPTSIPQ